MDPMLRTTHFGTPECIKRASTCVCVCFFYKGDGARVLLNRRMAKQGTCGQTQLATVCWKLVPRTNTLLLRILHVFSAGLLAETTNPPNVKTTGMCGNQVTWSTLHQWLLLAILVFCCFFLLAPLDPKSKRCTIGAAQT